MRPAARGLGEGGEWKEKGVVKGEEEEEEEELTPLFFSPAHTPSGFHPSLLHYS